MTRDEAICRWRDLTHTTVYTAEQARRLALDVRRLVMLAVGDVDAECAYRAAVGLPMYDDRRQ